MDEVRQIFEAVFACTLEVCGFQNCDDLFYVKGILNHCSDVNDGLGPEYGRPSVDTLYTLFSADDH